jgi:heavy metal translocating P-type ATPase
MNPHAERPAGCAYCGLPIPQPWWPWTAPTAPADGEKAYCCFGCRFAAAVTRQQGEEGAANWTLVCLGTAVFLTMNVMVFTMALWTQDFYQGQGETPGQLALVLHGLFRYLCLLFALPVILLLGVPLLENAWGHLRRGLVHTDLLLVVGVAASYLYSVISVVRDDGPVYFEVGCVVLVLVTVGRWLEARGRLQALAAIDALHRLLPARARLVRDGEEVWVPPEVVHRGDRVRVLPGERIPCDGQVLQHAAAVDEQVVTGESKPAVKEPGDAVYGGSLNLDGDLLITATAEPGDTVLARMIELVRRGQQLKGHFERLADRVTAVFLPAVMVVAGAAAAWHGSRHGLADGILTGLAVLLIACPCALGLATPMAVWSARGRAALAQVLFRHGEALERLASIRAIRIDKTGTLTTGTPAVAEFATAPDGDRDEVLKLAAVLAASSTHSYSQAIRQLADLETPVGRPSLAVRTAREGRPTRLGLINVQTLAGRGIIGRVEQANSTAPESCTRVLLGSPRLMAENALNWPPSFLAATDRARVSGQPLTCIGWEGEVRGVFVFREQLRPEAAEAIARLREQGLDVAILTGDSTAPASALGKELGVPVVADLLPDGKVAALAEARRRLGPVAMVGDGLNDAPALAAGDVGIALGCGTEVSRDSASVCLLGNDLGRLPWLIDLARRTVRVVRQNLFWAFVYNLVGVGFACTGRLNPVLAALAMVLSSLLVVANSLRLGGPADVRAEGAPRTAPPVLLQEGTH